MSRTAGRKSKTKTSSWLSQVDDDDDILGRLDRLIAEKTESLKSAGERIRQIQKAIHDLKKQMDSNSAITESFAHSSL